MAEEEFQLVVHEGPEPGRSYRLGQDAIIIGRDQYSDIVFDHPEVSRHHARLTCVDGGYVLQDLGSTNGTFVDGKQLGGDPVLLKEGQTVRLGGAVSLAYQRLPSTVPTVPTMIAPSPIQETVISEPGTLPEIHDTVTLMPTRALSNPYVGPRAFEPDERQFFYGRDEEISILAGQVMSRRASAFFAQSGAGKSSLLRAGLLPELTRQIKVGRGRRARVIQKMRVMPILDVGYNPPEERLLSIHNVYVLGALLILHPDKSAEEMAGLTLCEGLASYFGRSDAEVAGDDGVPDTVVAESVGTAGDDEVPDTVVAESGGAGEADLSTLMIFDQFEELFTYHPEHWRKREDFFRQVRQALEEYPDLHVLFSMREDFIAELTPYANLLPGQLRTRFRLERLKRDAALQAIVAPAQKAGRSFDEGVAEELVDNLRGGQPKQDRSGDGAGGEVELGEYVEPVHLQIVCRQLWENLPAKRKVIEAADVQAFGDVDQALTGFYESTLAEVTARTDISQRRLRAWFDAKVLTPARTRGLVYRGEDETEGLPNTAVNILNDAYIIRADVRGGDVWYQLAHDRLVDPVLEANVTWRENYQNPLDKATRAWLAAGRNPGRLLDGAQLVEAQAYADENPNDVLPEEQEFLIESRRQELAMAEQAERQAKRRRRTLIAAGVVGAVLLASTIFAVLMALQATSAKEEATINAELAETRAEEAQEAKTEAQFQAEEARLAEVAAVAAEESAVQAAIEASEARAEALTERDNAKEQQEEADRQREMAEVANALADVSRTSRDVNDPSLPLILAREALNVTGDVDGTLKNTARRALLDSVASAPPWLMNLPRHRHEAPVTRSDFSPDGQMIVSGSWDGTAKVWDLASGATLLTLSGHTDVVNSAAFSPDGATIVTSSDDGTARIWDATSGELLAILDGHSDWVDHASFDPSGERIVTAGADGVAKVWDASSGEEILVLEGHGDRVIAANFDPQGERIVTAGGDGTARVWDAGNGQELLSLEGHDDLVIWAVFSDAGDRVATAGSDGMARIWDAETGETVAFIEGSGEPIVSAMFSGDGEQLVTASSDWTGAVWDARNGDLIHELFGHGGSVKFADFSPDDELIMTTGEDRTIRLWDAATAEPLSTLGGSSGVATDADFNRDSSQLAVGTDDGTVIIWNVATGDELVRIKAHEIDLNAVDFSPDGQRIVTTGWDMENGTARVWDAENGAELLLLEGHDGDVWDAAFSPDGTSIATVGQDGQLLVWNADTGNIILFLEGVDDVLGVNTVAFSPDGSRLVTTGDDGSVKVWDATSAEQLLSFYAHGGDVRSAVFSPDGSRLLTSGTDRTASVWDAFSGVELLTLIGHLNWVRTAAFSPDGSMIVTASDDTTARLWDAESGEALRTLSGHGDWLTSATFSPNRRLIASTDRDGVTKLWDLAAPSLVPELVHDGSPIIQAAYTPDGQRLVTTGYDFAVRVWDADTGEELLSMAGDILDENPFDGSNSLAILPVDDGSGVITLWDVNRGEIVSTLAGHAGWVQEADVSGDGQIVLTFGCDESDEASGACAVVGTAKVWDAASGDEMLSVPIDLDNGAFELSRDGSRLVVSACSEFDEDDSCIASQLTIWDTTSGDEITTLDAGYSLIRQIEFSPDRSSIFTTDWNTTDVWDSSTGELLQSFPEEYGVVDLRGERLVTLGGEFTATIWDLETGSALATLSGHRDGINSIEFSPDGQHLITASWDGTARVWNADSGIQILTLTEHKGQVWDAHFSPDGSSIVTASEDGRALVWPFSVDRLLELSGPAIQRYSPFLTPEETARFGLGGD